MKMRNMEVKCKKMILDIIDLTLKYVNKILN